MCLSHVLTPYLLIHYVIFCRVLAEGKHLFTIAYVLLIDTHRYLIFFYFFSTLQVLSTIFLLRTVTTYLSPSQEFFSHMVYSSILMLRGSWVPSRHVSIFFCVLQILSETVTGKRMLEIIWFPFVLIIFPVSFQFIWRL